MLPQIHHERESAIDLNDCYIYSGLVTENDLLYQNQTFDSNNPSRHALPRIYREDGWTSSDEDTMTCFVVWQPRQKSFFRAIEQLEEGKHRKSLRRVSQLGVPGRSIVFKTRSRAERDHWVMNISMEIERLQQVEEVRVVSKWVPIMAWKSHLLLDGFNRGGWALALQSTRLASIWDCTQSRTMYTYPGLIVVT